jgi:hypothetical protein
MQQNCKIGWKFWLHWMIANVAGITLSLSITLYILELNMTVFSARYQLSGVGCFALWALLGLPAGVGLSQQLILRRYVLWSKHWVWLTISGWVMGYFAVMFFALLSARIIPSYLVMIMIAIASFGLTVGIAQAILLRQHVRRLAWWVVANVISFVIGAAPLLILIQITAYDTYLGGFIVGTIGSALIFSIITGFTMMWLLNHPKQSVPAAAPVTQVN